MLCRWSCYIYIYIYYTSKWFELCIYAVNVSISTLFTLLDLFTVLFLLFWSLGVTLFIWSCCIFGFSGLFLVIWFLILRVLWIEMSHFCSVVVGWAQLILDCGEGSNLVKVIRICFALVFNFEFILIIGEQISNFIIFLSGYLFCLKIWGLSVIICVVV